MIAGLKPYAEVKDSGVEWLGDVPAHWQMRRTKTLLCERVQKGFQEEPLLAATQTKGVVRKDQYENRTVLALKDLHLLKLVRVGDFVISLRSFQGGIEYAREQGIISPAYTVLYSMQPESHAFLAWLFKSKPFVENLSLFVTGIRQGQNIDYEKLSRSKLPFPPLPEQAAIVRFLDHADRRIRRAIAAKQKLIRLLEEQKQVIIHRAVTSGLDPDVRLKPSGVEWLGNVPEHWEIVRLKFVASHIVDCLHATPRYSDDGLFPAIRTADISPGIVRLDSARRVGADVFHQWTHRLAPAEGDILYSREGERFGIAACVPVGARLCISQRMMVFRIQSRYDSEFVMWLLNSPQVYAQATQDVMGSTAPHVNVATIRNFRLAIPPSAAEQNEVVHHIHEATQCLVRTIEDAHSEVSLLREYRTRLIADVVTGKLDVREAAARLPKSSEPEPADGAGLDADGDDDAELDEAVAEDMAA